MAERSLAQVEREIGRVVDGVAKEVFSHEEARRKLEPLRDRKAALEREIASLPTPVKTISLHPTAVQSYLTAVRNLHETLMRRKVEGNEDLARALRELLVAVVVHPGNELPRIEVKGRLALLTGDDMPPTGEIPGPPMLVAGSRYRRSRNTVEAEFRYAA